MNAKQYIVVAGLGAAIVGGPVVADRQIDPYFETPQKYEIAMVQTLPDSGEAKVEISKTEPAITLSKWNGEAGMTVKYPKIKKSGSRKFLTDVVEWKGAKEELHAYPIAAKAGMEDGGFEIEVVLNAKPATNRFDFTIEGADELDFFYQPALTQEEIDEGAFRPDNVIGSYAVYHKTKKNHRVGSTNYATGKAYHIYRPQICDANSVCAWMTLSYDGIGTLSFIAPQEFLDTATYPVKF